MTHNGYPVTDATGNLVDLDGNTLQEPFSHTPGFPGFSPTASQSLAVLADMQEAGIPVTYGYISDIHDKKSRRHAAAPRPGNALGPGDACYVAALQSYDNAFEKFFQRLAADGITPANTRVRHRRRGERPVRGRERRPRRPSRRRPAATA